MTIKSFFTKSITGLAMVAIMVIASGCADEGAQVASTTVGPTGPTNPNKYYFNWTVVPTTVQSGNTVIARAQVWDSSGNTAIEAPVAISGVDIDPAKSFGATGPNGWVEWVFVVTGSPGSNVYPTVTVEDISLTISVQVVPSPATAAAARQGN